jgi:DNA modification methylase
MSANLSSSSEWPADRVERRSVQHLVADARNARTHTDAQVAQIAAAIREWGWTNPVLIDENGTIIAGHGRVLAARLLGIPDVPVMVARGWSEAQKRAYILADNKLALNAGWNEELLAIEVAGLADMGFDLPLIGFSEDELAALSASPSAGLTDRDQVPDAPVNPVSRPGDVWLLGRHRLVCGDCTDQDVVARALNGTTPHLMVTDPPYGVHYDPAWRERSGLAGQGIARGKVENDDRADWRDAWALFPGDVAYVWHGGLHAAAVAESLQATGFQMRCQIIWDKTRLIIGRGDYHWGHEPCWYAVRKGRTGHWQGDRSQTTIWAIPHRKSESGHGTQKPVEAMRRPIENNSSPGQAVFEPFSGSGTTIIAGEMTGRAVHAIELNPAYIDVAVKRWQEFTGEMAVLEETGRSFGEVDLERFSTEETHLNSAGCYDEGIAELRRRKQAAEAHSAEKVAG